MLLSSNKVDFTIKAVAPDAYLCFTFDVVRGWLVQSADTWYSLEDLPYGPLKRICDHLNVVPTVIVYSGRESVSTTAHDAIAGQAFPRLLSQLITCLDTTDPNAEKLVAPDPEVEPGEEE